MSRKWNVGVLPILFISWFNLFHLNDLYFWFVGFLALGGLLSCRHLQEPLPQPTTIILISQQPMTGMLSIFLLCSFSMFSLSLFFFLQTFILMCVPIRFATPRSLLPLPLQLQNKFCGFCFRFVLGVLQIWTTYSCPSGTSFFITCYSLLLPSS